jgi:hypothetical protein
MVEEPENNIDIIQAIAKEINTLSEYYGGSFWSDENIINSIIYNIRISNALTDDDYI